MKLELNDTLLYKPTIPFDFANPPMDPNELVAALGEAMCSLGGLGISCNQVNLPYRVFVMGSPNDPESIIPVFNPRVVSTSEETEYADEGCLSIPGFFISIKRPKEIRVRMDTVNGETETARFNGMTARVFNHEMDHMDGLDFRKRATRYHKEKASKDYKLFLRRQKRAA